MKFDEYEMTFVYTRYFHETTFLPLGVIIRHIVIIPFIF